MTDRPAGSPRLSLCMIVRDSTRTLRPCLESIRPFVDEMIVVDTGSLDDTRQIAADCGAKVFEFPWVDDFAAARNESLRHAQGEWIFWMDSDDTIDAENGQKLRELVGREHPPQIMGMVMQVHCPSISEDGDLNVTVVDHIKLFRNRPEIRFEGRIHEQVLPSIRRLGGDVGWTDAFVVHSGADYSPAGREKKNERDLRLLQLDLRDRPGHPFVLFNLGMTHADAGDDRSAVEYLELGREAADPQESHVRKLYALLLQSYRRLGDQAKAWETCLEGRRIFPEDRELRFLEGTLHHQQGRLKDAEAAYVRAMEPSKTRHFSSVDDGVSGHKACRNLAQVYMDAGQLPAAEECLWRAIELRPGSREGWRMLGNLLLQQGRLAAAAVQSMRLMHDALLRPEGLLLASRILVARGEKAEAIELMNLATRERPQDLELLDAQCELLFMHGEPAAAAGPLAKLAARIPGNPATLHNLGAVNLRCNRPSEAEGHLRQSLALRPDYPPTLLYLGMALHAQGKLDEAQSAWQDVLRLGPDTPAGKEAAQCLGRLPATASAR
jgi:tetratricopeptide (TPR) repeat protein